jgi:hypothetical protein
MGAFTGAMQHAGVRYKRTYGLLRHPIRGAETEAHHLYEIEQAGESGETPFIVILGLVFFLGSIFVVLLGIALAAYYLA